MLKAKSTTKKIFDAIADQAKETMIGKELKMKTHSLTFGFNNPENPGTSITLNTWLGGKTHIAQRDALHARYNDTQKGSEFDKQVNGAGLEIVKGYLEISVQTSSAEAASGHCSKI